MDKTFSDLLKEFDLLYQFGSPLRYEKLNRGYEFRDKAYAIKNSINGYYVSRFDNPIPLD
jgi:hypothetical protein